MTPSALELLTTKFICIQQLHANIICVLFCRCHWSYPVNRSAIYIIRFHATTAHSPFYSSDSMGSLQISFCLLLVVPFLALYSISYFRFVVSSSVAVVRTQRDFCFFKNPFIRCGYNSLSPLTLSTPTRLPCLKILW